MDMSYDYTIYFTKSGRYFGGWAFDSFTTWHRTIAPMCEKHPEVFEGQPYEGHDGYHIVEIKVNEDQPKNIENLAYEYIDDVEYSFFMNLKDAVEMALEKQCKVFLG